MDPKEEFRKRWKRLAVLMLLSAGLFVWFEFLTPPGTLHEIARWGLVASIFLCMLTLWPVREALWYKDGKKQSIDGQLILVGNGQEADKAAQLLKNKGLIFQQVTDHEDMKVQLAFDMGAPTQPPPVYLKVRRPDFSVELFVGLERIKQAI